MLQGRRNRPYTVVVPEKYSVFGLDVQSYRNERSGLSQPIVLPLYKKERLVEHTEAFDLFCLLYLTKK